MAANVTVTKFSPDNAHLALEKIGQIETDIKKPASIMATKIAEQTGAKGDVSVETNAKLQKAIASAREKVGFVGEYAEQAKDKISTVKAQADGIKKHAQDLYSSGKGAYKTYYSDPINYVRRTKEGILDQVRNVAGMRFKIDDLLIGEDARRLLMEGIKSICGTGGLNPFTSIFGAYKSLLDILDNIHLFDDSDLLKAIVNCNRFTDDHAKVITTKTTVVAENGNTTTYLEMTKIEDVRVSQGDINTLLITSPDTTMDASNIVNIYGETGMDVGEIVMTEDPVNELIVLDAEKISDLSDKPILIQTVVTEANIPLSPNTIRQTANISRPNQNNLTPAHSILSLLRQKNTSAATTLQKNLVAAGRINNVVSVEHGVTNPVDISPLVTSPKTRVVGTSIPTNWSTGIEEKTEIASTEALLNPDDLSLAKISTCGDMIFSTPIEDLIPQKKDPYANIPFIKFGTISALTPKKIKSWNITKDKGGNELRIPVY